MTVKSTTPLEKLLEKAASDLLTIEDLRVSFSVQKKEIEAVRGVSFSLQKGDSLGIVGESGSGKSTIAKAITKLIPFSKLSGKVLFQGKDLLQLSEKELSHIRGKEIGHIFQDPMSALNPTMRIGTQVEEAFLYHKMGSPREAREKALDLFQILSIAEPLKKLEQYPHELSGGMRQRVLIAMALMTNPSLLIADEPTTALDIILTAQTLTLLKKAQAHFGTSLILITHDLGVVKRSCNYILVLYGGKVVEMGKTLEVLENPQHPYTQLLSASIPSFDQDRDKPLPGIEGIPPDLSQKISGCSFKTRCPFRKEICEKEPPFQGSSACWRGQT